jgi:recombinase
MAQRVLNSEDYTGRAYWVKRKGIGKLQWQARPRDAWLQWSVPAIIDETTFLAVQQ